MAVAAAALKFSRGVLQNSAKFPPVAKFDASRDNDAGHDHRGTPASKRILGIASGSGAKTLFRIFLRTFTRCFYLAHFPEAGDSSAVKSIVSIPEFLIRLFTAAAVALQRVLCLTTSALFVPFNKTLGSSIRPGHKKISRDWQKYISPLLFVLKLFRAMHGQCGKVVRKVCAKSIQRLIRAKLFGAPEAHIIKIEEM